MSVIKPIFLRPIEINSSNDSFSAWIDNDGMGLDEYVITLDNGVWANVFTLAAGIAQEISAASGTPTTASLVVSGDELVIQWQIENLDNGYAAPQMEFTENYDIVGATSATKGADTFIDTGGAGLFVANMPYRPTHCWIPKYQNANQDRFRVIQGDAFNGVMAKSGFLSGNRSGPTIYWRDLFFVNEPAENIYKEAATSSRMPQRSFETFATECRASSPTVSGNPSTKGFYFFPDWNTLQTTASNLTTDNGGINFDYSSSPNTFVFCQMAENGPGEPRASLPTTRDYYEVGFAIHTVDNAVSWTYYSA